MSPQPAYTIPARALVAYTSSSWSLQRVLCRAPGPGELLVRIVASGICHTDVANAGGIAPRILGHEGAGYVLRRGPGVSSCVAEGAPVLLSFAHCGECYFCAAGHPAHCVRAVGLTIAAAEPNYALAEGEEDDERLREDAGGRRRVVCAGYFGHSCFSSVALVKESCVVPAADLIRSEDELRLFAPLGCGIQTGACAVANVARLGEGDSLAVFGLGGVGLGAVMAAKARGVATIVAVDILQSRIDLAISLGATHGIDSRDMSKEQLAAAIRSLPPFEQPQSFPTSPPKPLGPSAVIDTTGRDTMLQAALAAVNRLGRVVQLANQGPGSSVSVGLPEHMRDGVHFTGTIQGDAVPRESIPMLVKWYREGKLPLEKLVRFYRVEEFEKAKSDMHSGEVIKPILLW